MRRSYHYIEKKIGSYFRIDSSYFIKGGFWLTVTQGAVLFAGIISTAIFAHFLQESQYGTYRYLISLAALFSAFSLTGLGQSILQTAAKKYAGFYIETIKTNLIYSLGITFFSLAAFSYYLFKDNSTLAFGCLLISLLQPLINTYQNTSIFLQGEGRYKESTFSQSFKVFITTSLSVAALYFTKDILILFLTYLISNLVTNWLIHSRFLPNCVVTTPRKVFDTYMQYAKHTSVRNLIGSISNRLDTILIFTQLGAGELAIYTIATVIPEQIKASFKNLAALLLPKYATNNVENLLKSVRTRSMQLLACLILITVAYLVTVPHVYALLFPKYETAVFFSQVSALAFPAFVLLIPYSILQSHLAEEKLYKITLYGSIFQVISLITLIYFYGLLGAVISKILYRFFTLVLTYSALRKISQ